MKKKACALAAAMTLSTMLAVPAFAANDGVKANHDGTGNTLFGTSPAATSTPGVNATGDTGPTYSGTTGAGNYGTNANGTYGPYGSPGTGTFGINNDNAGRNTIRALADDGANMDWGWLGLLGLVGLAGLMGKNRDYDRDRAK